ncbi:MAG: multi-sensor signal transduction histidine kinase, partial [Myxococcaceae bacterium]|nr:multi-sensor signal transduction histidine kinase [Myxococcaceae bacterium]
EEPVSPKHKAYLGYILSSSAHLLRLLNDVLDIARVESGTTPLRLESVDLAQLVAEVRDVTLGIEAKKRLRIDLEIAEIGNVTVDPVRIKQVLYNYLSNAIKFTPDGGRIRIGITLEDAGSFRIEVADNGIGIAPEEFGLLFREFAQLDASSAKHYQGTGLGLVLTKRIVEAHGGAIEVRSAKGFGSAFCATFPRNGPRPGAVARPPQFSVARPFAQD